MSAANRPARVPSPVSAQEEIRRVVPVIAAIAARLPVPVSVDTCKPEVMRAAVAAGAGLINDVRALQRPGALEAAADLGVPVCLMHMQGEPDTMQQGPAYGDVVAEVAAFLRARMAACMAAGIPAGRILLDPGFGFGKTLAHNLTLLARLRDIAALGPPLLVGLSRKSMLGAITGRAGHRAARGEPGGGPVGGGAGRRPGAGPRRGRDGRCPGGGRGAAPDLPCAQDRAAESHRWGDSNAEQL